ncbi:GIY-YIG nuclease family protein [Methylomonas sp. UP202]|uniref:GIY-YIG nuclease family protein n=1 Tax=Methylomonas sp. UP202 TaxID=3040943 RepID=UPI00247AD2D6|nr:GIY-YIG nuclease family protein [Methylomonas sp. UP202]WGS87544.1 GIY-YIG nuclease family protein [Methylomonas sp. UP202]
MNAVGLSDAVGLVAGDDGGHTAPNAEVASAAWSVYIVLCQDGSLYTGISTDVARRFDEHRSGRGAKFFRSRIPLAVAYRETGHDRASASRREAAIKKLSKPQKLALIEAAGGRETP